MTRTRGETAAALFLLLTGCPEQKSAYAQDPIPMPGACRDVAAKMGGMAYVIYACPHVDHEASLIWQAGDNFTLCKCRSRR